jgi:hypothetical protein
MFHKLRLTLLLSGLCLVAHCQYTTGQIEGSVLDPTSATVEGCAITLTSVDTQISRYVITPAAGVYVFSAVPPGRYRLTAAKPGFRTAAAEVAVYTSQVTTQNFSLQVGEQAATVEVSSEATPVVDAGGPLRQVTRDGLELEGLPSSRRDITNVIVLAPGVTPTFTPSGGNLTTLSIAQAGQLNSNGGRSKATAHQLDYTDANDWEYGGIALATQPAPDMLSEFHILTNNWSAEYGVKSNAEVLMITRSGSNELHGSAYDFLQNSALNARDFFDQTGNATPLRQNYFGLSAGGAARKNRTFLFGGYEGRRTRGAGNTFLANLPTASARSQATDPDVVQILNLLPLPSAATSNPQIGTSAILAPSPANADLFAIRGDHYFTDRNSLTVRYFQNLGTSYSRTAGSLPAFDATFDPQGRNAMIADTWVLSPSATNELRLAYGRSSALFSPATLPATPRFSVAGLVGFGTVQSWPQGRIFNIYQLNDSFSYTRGRHFLKAGFDLRNIQDNSINDTSRRGVYTFTSLATFLAGTPSAYSQVFGNTYRGFRTSFPGFFAQDDWRVLPSLTLNLGIRWEYQGGLSAVHNTQSVLDPGVPGTIGQAGSGYLGTFRTQNPLVSANPGLIAPRFGFAWNPNAGPLVVRGGYGIYYDSLLFNGLQAGRTTPPSDYTGSLAGTAISGANSFDNLYAGTAAIQQSLNAQLGNFGSLANLGSIVSMKPNLRNPYVQQYSLGIEYRLSPAMAADVSYVGTRGTALTTYEPENSVAPGRRPAPAISTADEQARLAQFQAAVAAENGTATTQSDRLDPRFNDVSLIGDSGSSTYNSLQIALTRSIAKGLLFHASYTWSKSIDNSSDYSPGQATNDHGFAQDQFNLANERAVSAYDIPQRFTLSHVWQLPFFRTQKGIVGHALGGWTFSSIEELQSGIPFTVLSGPRLGISDVNMDGNLVSSLDNSRANCAPGGVLHLGLAGTQSNTEYSQPLLGNNGTCGRNTGRMSELIDFDWTFGKRFTIFERGPLGSGPWAVEYRADLFNIFNTVFLTATGDNFRTVSDPSFGIFNAAGTTRRVQMSLRLTW